MDLTGRVRWSESNGPEGYAGREPIELLADLLFRTESLWTLPLIPLEHKGLKREIGLDEEQRFFSPRELMMCTGLHETAQAFQARKEMNSKERPSPAEKAAVQASQALSIFASFMNGNVELAIVPVEGSEAFGEVGGSHRHAEADPVRPAYEAFGEAYRAGEGIDDAALALVTVIENQAGADPSIKRRVGFEYFYNHHRPWRMAAIATVLALLLLGARALVRWRVLGWAAGLAIAWAVGEQLLGLGLRIAILERAPVSNTFEAILWTGLIALVIGGIAQTINRKGWYLAAGLAASLAAILFASLVPLADQTGSLPAVLRSNYWLILHVLIIVASYGALLLGAILGHIYLVRDVLLHRPPEPDARVVVQIYRTLQIGLILLTIGTILGGVWAAESWGRFWGWDPKETWSLISIVVYMGLLHARYVGWLRDFGLAVAAIVGFMAIVWTFYGVNYIMAAGLHSYGFGSGGEKWVALWGAAEVIFLLMCALRKPRRPGRLKRSQKIQTPVRGTTHSV